MPERDLGKPVHSVLRQSSLGKREQPSGIIGETVFSEEKGSRRLLNRAGTFFEGGSRFSEAGRGVGGVRLENPTGEMGSERFLRRLGRRGRRGQRRGRSCGCLSRGEGRHRCPKRLIHNNSVTVYNS